MARLKIKHAHPSPAVKEKLLETLAAHNIYSTKVVPLRDCYVIVTSRDEEVDYLFSPECHTDLRNAAFTAVMPPDLKAKRTILLFGIDEDAFDHNPEEIREEIYALNEFTVDCIDTVYKFSNSRVVKITFCNTNPAIRAREIGIKMFYTRIPPHQIQQEEYLELKNCLRCYAIEDHVAAQCTKAKDYKICSECSEVGHFWRECESTQKKCINCKGDHRTLAFKCPLRKAAFSKARESAKSTTRTYNQVAATPPTPQQQYQPTPTLPLETQEKIHSIMKIAMLKDSLEPGTFEDVYNRILKRNNIAQIVIGEPIDCRSILNLTTPTNTNTNTTTPPTTAASNPTPISDPPASPVSLVICSEPSTPPRDQATSEINSYPSSPEPDTPQEPQADPIPLDSSNKQESTPSSTPTTSSSSLSTPSPSSPPKASPNKEPPKDPRKGKETPKPTPSHLTNTNLSQAAALAQRDPKSAPHSNPHNTRNNSNNNNPKKWINPKK